MNSLKELEREIRHLEVLNELKQINMLAQAQRQADIQRISYMFAIPVKDIEKVLESKV